LFFRKLVLDHHLIISQHIIILKVITMLNFVIWYCKIYWGDRFSLQYPEKRVFIFAYRSTSLKDFRTLHMWQDFLAFLEELLHY